MAALTAPEVVKAQAFNAPWCVVATVVIVWLLVSLRTVGGRWNTFGIGCVVFLRYGPGAVLLGIAVAAGILLSRLWRNEV